jgi:hypothetical protein
MNKLVELLVILLVFASVTCVTMADENATDVGNATVVNSPDNSAVSAPATTDTSVSTPVTQVQTPAPVQAPVNGKIRISPTVQLRTIQSEVNKDTDAVIDEYMSNAIANDGDLVVYTTLEVPSDVLIRSSQGSDQGDSGIAETSYVIKPGNNMHVQLHAICSKVGKYPVTMNAQYYVGTDKDNIKSVGLATEFNVVEPSTQFHMDTSDNTQNTNDTNGTIINGMTFTTNELIAGAGFLLLLIAIIGLALRR